MNKCHSFFFKNDIKKNYTLYSSARITIPDLDFTAQSTTHSMSSIRGTCSTYNYFP